MALAKVLVTGDQGTVGRIAERTLSGPFEIIGFDKSRNRRQDILDLKQLGKAMRGCEFVIHCAAVPHPSLAPFDVVFETNVVGTRNVLKAALSAGVRRVALISSIAYYGIFNRPFWKPHYFPIDEQHPPFFPASLGDPDRLDIYGQSKMMAEQLAAWFGANMELEVISLRLARIGSSSDLLRPSQGLDPYNDATLRETLWSNVNEERVALALERCLKFNGKVTFEAFNVVNEHVADVFSVRRILATHYPDVPLKKLPEELPGLFSVEKFERILSSTKAVVE